MVELKMYVSEVDFDAAIRMFAGTGMAGNAAAAAAGLLSDSAKEELAVKYLNANSEKLEAMMEAAAERKGVRVKFTGACASLVKEES